MNREMLKEQSLDFLLATIECIGDGVIITDVNGIISYMNSAAEELINWQAAQVKGKAFSEIFPIANYYTDEILPSPVEQVLREGVAAGLKDNSAILIRDGAKKFVSANCSPILLRNGELVGVVVMLRDITQKKELETSLVKSRDFYLKFLDNLPAIVWHSNKHMEWESVNRTWAELTGKTAQEALGLGWSEAVHLEEMDNLLKRYASAIESQKPFEYEHRLKGADGEYRWVMTMGKPYYDLEGSFAGFMGFTYDITERKDFEVMLEKVSNMYLRILEGFPAIIWRTDSSGKLTYLDKNWEIFSGASAGLVDFKGEDFIHPEDVQQARKIYLESFNQQQPFESEYRVLRHDGEYRWLLNIGRPFYDIDQRFDGYIGMALDITDRKIAEEGLQRYGVLSEKARDIILFVDMDGNIVEANEAAVKAYGYTNQELLSMTIFDLRQEKVKGQAAMEVANRQGIFFETTHYRKDGTGFPVEVSSQGADISGKRVLLSIIRDISKRKEVESELKRAKEQAEMANKSKSEFLANMSHEIRTPINGMMGMIDLTLLTDLSYEQQENLTIAKGCANSLLNIINDILNFSKLEAGKLTINEVGFDLKALVEDTVRSHSPSALDKRVELNYAFSATLPKLVTGDPNRIQQVLNNLLNNAIKFTERGQVDLSIKADRGIDDKYEVTFKIADSGIGIADHDKDKLFKTFSQVDGSITRRFGGTGLGLVISKQLVELMGGRMWFESQLGRGSNFYFTVSLKEGGEPKVQNPVPAPLPKKVNRYNQILLVEDDKVNQMVLNRMLLERGYRVDLASNGKEALLLHEQQKYDVILMDIHMPEMDGMEATRKIREREAFSGESTHIIALTAHVLEGDRERFLAIGMDGYISKPVMMHELYSAIDKATEADKLEVKIDAEGRLVYNGDGVWGKGKNNDIALEKLDILVHQLEEIIVAADIKEELAAVEKIANGIKELAGSLDVDELKMMAFRIELATRRGNLEDALRYASTMVQEYNTFKKHL